MHFHVQPSLMDANNVWCGAKHDYTGGWTTNSCILFRWIPVYSLAFKWPCSRLWQGYEKRLQAVCVQKYDRFGFCKNVLARVKSHHVVGYIFFFVGGTLNVWHNNYDTDTILTTEVVNFRERVSACSLTPNEHLFSYIRARTSFYSIKRWCSLCTRSTHFIGF